MPATNRGRYGKEKSIVVKSRNHLLRLLCAATVAAFALPANAQVVYSNNFDSAPTLGPGVGASLSGITTTVAVPTGYVNLGAGFSGNMLRNDSGGLNGGLQGSPGSPTILTLTGLPAHTSVSITTLLAIIDSWDGDNAQYGRDIFTITVDGSPVFSESFLNSGISGGQSFNPGSYPNITTLANDQDLGFSSGVSSSDDAYAFGLLNIPHTASTLTVTIVASGTGWQGNGDESWGLDNLQISVASAAVNGPEPASIALLLLGGTIAGTVVAKRRKA